jgi:hypothetical protein
MSTIPRNTRSQNRRDGTRAPATSKVDTVIRSGVDLRAEKRKAARSGKLQSGPAREAEQGSDRRFFKADPTSDSPSLSNSPRYRVMPCVRRKDTIIADRRSRDDVRHCGHRGRRPTIPCGQQHRRAGNAHGQRPARHCVEDPLVRSAKSDQTGITAIGCVEDGSSRKPKVDLPTQEEGPRSLEEAT